MAAAPLPPFVSVEEYLHADYEHDMDYVDGVLEERDLGENSHSNLQGELLVLFRNHRDQWHVKTYVEQRVQISPTRYRVPDLCVMPASWKNTPIITQAPILCIEILSPEDRLKRTLTKCNDYFRLGTPEAWIFDPDQRTAMVLRPDGSMTTHRDGALTLEGTPIHVSLAEVFAVLDEGLDL